MTPEPDASTDHSQVALVSSLKQQGITDTVVPASSLAIFLLLAALLGLLAASWPARLDVLAAISAQLCAHRDGLGDEHASADDRAAGRGQGLVGR